MKKLPLSSRKLGNVFAMVDDEDYEMVSKYYWSPHLSSQAIYAERRSSKESGYRTIKMHREIMGNPVGMQIDHIDGNGLNNQKENLRVVTQQENLYNKRKYANGKSSRFIGVSFCNRTKKFAASVSIGGKNKFAGYFACQEDAAKARDALAMKLRGEYARLNFKVEA